MVPLVPVLTVTSGTSLVAPSVVPLVPVLTVTRGTATKADAAPGTVARVSDVVPPKPGGKGRPTPKRNQARQSRPVAPPPRTRKEAVRRQREQAREARKAQRGGDDRHLPPSLRGPEREAVRDAVDSRLSLGWLALPGLGLNVASFVVSDEGVKRLLANIGFVLFMMLVVDTVSTLLRVKRVLAARFPDGTEASRGSLLRYGVARNIALRRTRVPRPRVRVGEDVIGDKRQRTAGRTTEGSAGRA